MNGKDFTIGVLSVTAVVLFVGLVILQVHTPPAAVAMGQSMSAGEYIITTAQLDQTAEVIYVLNTEANRMVAYGFNAVAGRIEPIQQLDVDALVRGAAKRSR